MTKKERKNCISNRLAVLKMIRQQSSNCKYMTLSDFIYQLPPIFLPKELLTVSNEVKNSVYFVNFLKQT